jgi:hypothetical protein
MKRFFADDSFWNAPVPADAETDPRSGHCIELLRREPTGGLHINTRHYTIPVYEVDGTTPRRTVHQRRLLDQEGKPRTRGGTGRTFSHGAGFGPQVPFPDHAVPDPATDAHMAMVDRGSRMVWDMFAVGRREDGEWESLTGMQYALDGRGWWAPSEFPAEDGESIHFHGPGRAAGVPIVAGLIMREEVLAGEVRHKLAFATRYSAYKEFVTPPATWTDGNLVGGIPEGALLQLDPSLDLDRFGLGPGARAVARALQVYGMVNVDWAAASALYAEGLYYDGAPRWQAVLDEWDLGGIPVEALRLVRMENVIALGDGRRRTTDPADVESRP